MKKAWKYLVVLFTAIILYYFMLPAINIHDYRFYFYILILLVEFLILSLPESVSQIGTLGWKYFFKSSTVSVVTKVILGVIGVLIVYLIGTSIVFSPFFNAKASANRITIDEVSLSEIPEYSFNTTAIIDRSSASKLGDKVMGEMPDLVSQFLVSGEYSQISYKEGTYRVTHLAYDGFIKYVKNMSKGIPGYIIVNTTTGLTELKRLEKGMKYVPSAYFFDNLYRKLRISHPFDIFGSPTFEIDEEGNPYYVCTTYTYRGISSLRKVTGVVLFDPVTGESEKYSIEDAPSWIDRIYPEDLVIAELDDNGKYKSGFINSIIGQEGVIQTSEGYNYISKDGDIWLYTGMTSIISDESNIGFCLVNLRTHRAEYIATSGADEYSVMRSAEGEVLNYGYTATFPVLVNIDNSPMYILSLKDSAGLVKMYAMVDARDYQQVYTVKASNDAKTSIEELIEIATGKSAGEVVEGLEQVIYVDSMDRLVIEGNTYLYLKYNGDTYVLKITLDNSLKALSINAEQSLKIKYYEDNGLKIITEIVG